ncbi:MAG: tetratricopeptide (TPR) repeat protein [Gammaproteobacteria bacterium]|jgi:tetratricopeptide (TPR) repeat protein
MRLSAAFSPTGMTRSSVLLFSITLPLVLASLAACTSPAPDSDGEQVVIKDETSTEVGMPTDVGVDEIGDETDRSEIAIDLVRAGDFRAARDLLGVLLLEQERVTALGWLAEGSPEDALVVIDRALRLDGRDPEAVFLKARASFALGEKAIADGGPGSLVTGSFQDALRFYKRGGEDVRALLGASRAAVRLQRYEEALGLAQRALASLDARGVEPRVAADPNSIPFHWQAGEAWEVEVAPERVLAEAAYRAFVQAKQAEPESARTQELFTQTEDALDKLLGRSRDSWTWTTLVDLYLWQGDLVSARSQAENGLDRDPTDFGLIDRLANISYQSGGSADMAATFASFNERHPAVTRAIWYEAQGLFDRATDAVMPLVASAITGEAVEPTEDADKVPALFLEAEEAFQRCRATDSSYDASCLGYEALTHNGLGWYLFSKGSLEEATAAFLSTEEVYEGGLFAEFEGRLLSGIQGIAQVGGSYNANEDWRAAGRSFALIAAVDRSRSTWANNQGFFYRDSAVELETIGRALCAAAKAGSRDEDLLAALAARSDTDLRGTEMANDAMLMEVASQAAMTEARRQMQLSWEGYQLAAELAPDDVRIVNDAGLVLVYYLHERLDLAEELLLRASVMGEEQMAAGADLDETQRFEIANAWGDAYQNLGVLYANERDDTAKAIAFFERAIEIGPDPRPLLTNAWIPFLRGELDTAGGIPNELRLKTWADPCVR